MLIEYSDGKMTPSGHNWVQGQGSGPRLKGDADEEEEVRPKFQAHRLEHLLMKYLEIWCYGQQNSLDQEGEETYFCRAPEKEEGAHGEKKARWRSILWRFVAPNLFVGSFANIPIEDDD